MTHLNLPEGCRCWLAPALSVVGVLGLAPAARAGVPFNTVHGVSAEAYQAWINKTIKEGYRAVHVSVCGMGGAAPRFSAVALKNGKNYPWEAHHGLTAAQYSKHCDDLYKKGLRVVSVSGYRQNNATRFAALWVKDGANWVGRHDLTAQQYAQNCGELNKKGFRVSCVSGYPAGNDVHFVAVWVADKKEWVGRHHLTEAQYRQAYAEFWPKGYRPVSITAYPLGKETRFAVVFTREGGKDSVVARHNLTATRYQNDLDRWAKAGGRPLAVTGYPWQGQMLYAAVFTGDQAVGPAALGQWSPVMQWPLVAIHAALLPTGKVLVWPRLENDDPKATTKTKVKNLPRPKEESWPHLWDPATGQLTITPRPPFNPFCSGHAFLPDGRLFIAGGHLWSNFWGDGRVTIYDPVQNSWARGLPAMNNRRWYPSCVTLPNGHILVVAGTYEDGKNNALAQVWQGGSNPWRNLTGAQDDKLPFYPFLHVAPNGRVFMAGPLIGTRYLDTAGTGKWTNVGDRASKQFRDYGASVMYEPGKVLVLGGGTPPVATAEVIDLNAKTPTWRLAEPMGAPRRHLNATLLPDGSIFVSGGTAAATEFEPKKPSFNDATGVVLGTEVWDPTTRHWSSLAEQHVRRLYHSTALLLPDGRVLSAGGGEPAGEGPKGKVVDTDHRDAQIFSPYYLFRGTRPVITAAPRTVKYGQQFEVKTPDASRIRKVTFIRLGSTTHAYNFDQRLNYLQYKVSGASLTLTAPANGNLAPPGHYMLFLLNEQGVPSVAKIVRLG
jgi:hypothetical protein